MKVHEFWVDPEGVPWLDHFPLDGCLGFQMWREPTDFIGDEAIVHVELKMVCRIAGPERSRAALERAFGEAMEAIGDED